METIDRYFPTFLLNALWQAPLAAAAAAIVCRAIRNGPARYRHVVWVAALAASLLLPVSSLRPWRADAPVLEVPQRSLHIQPLAIAAPPAAAETPVTASREVPVGRRAARIAFGVYLVLILLRLAWLVRAGFRTAGIRAAATPVSGALLDRVGERCAAAFRTRASLRSSPKLAVPVTAGQCILLPESLAVDPCEELLTTAIGHEMAHVARRDFALNLLYETLCLPLAFHPAVRWIRREIARTREMACDEMVAGRLVERAVYARSILHIASRHTRAGRPAYALGMFDGDILEERVRRLLRPPEFDLQRARLGLSAGLAAFAASAVIASGLAISARAQSAAQPEMTLGVSAFNRGDFPGAVSHFERAVKLDPAYAMARLHLANALIRDFMVNTVKSADESIEPPLLQRAKQQYREILVRDPDNIAAIFGIVALNGPDRTMESRELMLKVIALEPRNHNAYYTAGTLDWQLAYRPIQEARRASRMNATDPRIPDASVRQTLRDKWMPHLEEGFRMLQIAQQLNDSNGGTAAYLSLIARTKAAIVDSPAEAAALNRQSDEWVAKARSLPRAHRADSAVGINADEPPPLAVPMPPPPPPPPPPPKEGNH